jgi:nucleotide-binding universal stress UspA family protein
MSYKSITVCLDGSATSARALTFAIALAAHNNAHLTGLHLTYLPIIISEPYAMWGPMLTEWEESAQTRQRQAKEQFLAEASKSGINADFAGYRNDDLQEVIAHARASDLTIMTQKNASGSVVGSDDAITAHLIESMVLNLGRPVLLLPQSGYLPQKFDTIIVAWDGGREATRAVADAMPFLKSARVVKVLSVSEEIDDEHDLPDVDIATYLAKHDIKVDIERKESVHRAPAEWLLSRASEGKADLMVMGAYGHNRFAELVLGGVTRSVMRHMHLPVLMSH